MKMLVCYSGWGWVIVAASFVVNLIADGATFSFGIVYVELLDYFKKSRGYTAWIGGLFNLNIKLKFQLNKRPTVIIRFIYGHSSAVGAVGLFTHRPLRM